MISKGQRTTDVQHLDASGDPSPTRSWCMTCMRHRLLQVKLSSTGTMNRQSSDQTVDVIGSSGSADAEVLVVLVRSCLIVLRVECRRHTVDWWLLQRPTDVVASIAAASRLLQGISW